MGLFVSADSVVPDWYDPQSLNRFAYCRNNPLLYVDPSGHEYESWAEFENRCLWGMHDLMWAPFYLLELPEIAVDSIFNTSFEERMFSASATGFPYDDAFHLGLRGLSQTYSGLRGLSSSISKFDTDGLLNYMSSNSQRGSISNKIRNGGNYANEIGDAFETLLVKKFSGEGGFKSGGVQFDGKHEKIWYEAKAGKFWENVALNDIPTWRSKFGKKNRIAKDKNREFRVYSEYPIPEVFKKYFKKKNIKYLENIKE